MGKATLCGPPTLPQENFRSRVDGSFREYTYPELQRLEPKLTEILSFLDKKETDMSFELPSHYWVQRLKLLQEMRFSKISEL
jgi:hypothetical protein